MPPAIRHRIMALATPSIKFAALPVSILPVNAIRLAAISSIPLA